MYGWIYGLGKFNQPENKIGNIFLKDLRIGTWNDRRTVESGEIINL